MPKTCLMFHQDKFLAAHRAGDAFTYMTPWMKAVGRMIKAGIHIHEITIPLTCECHKEKLMHICNNDESPFTWDELKDIMTPIAADLITMHEEDHAAAERWAADEADEGDPLPPS